MKRQELLDLAMPRFNRAWQEAETIANKVEDLTEEYLEKVRGSKESLSLLFNNVSSCKTCDRCCTNALFDSGYFTHAERVVIIKSGINIREYIEDRSNNDNHPARCLFLGENGCNIPSRYRSQTCLGYICQDRVAPELVKIGLASRFKERRTEALTTLSHIQNKVSDIISDTGD